MCIGNPIKKCLPGSICSLATNIRPFFLVALTSIFLDICEYFWLELPCTGQFLSDHDFYRHQSSDILRRQNPWKLQIMKHYHQMLVWNENKNILIWCEKNWPAINSGEMFADISRLDFLTEDQMLNKAGFANCVKLKKHS